MSITIVKDIPEYNSAYNTIELECDSTNVGMTGFQYIMRLNIEGAATYKQFNVDPEPSQNYGVKDFHRFIETEVYPTIFDPTTTAAVEYADDTGIQSIIKFDIDIYELWDVAGVPTLDPDAEGPVNTGDKYAWEASFRHHDWIDEANETTPFNTWLMNATNGASAQFLTDNKAQRVGILDYGVTNTLTDVVADLDYVQYKSYDSAGTLIQTVEINILVSNGLTKFRNLRVATSPASINAVTAGVITGALPLVTSSVASYTVQMFSNTGPTAVSEILTFTVEEACRYDMVRVHFLNELGGFDSFNFRFRNQESSTSKGKTGRFNPYNVVSGGINYSHSNYGATTLQTTTTNKIKVRSDYLTDAENEWIRQLAKSREAYIQFTDKQGHTALKPIKSVSRNWVEKVGSIDKLYNVEFDLELAWLDLSQRR